MAQQRATSADNGTGQAAATSQGTATQLPPTAQADGEEQAPGRSRGNGALFGGSDSSAKHRSRALDLSLSLSTAYDDDLTDGQGVTPLQPSVSGEFSDVSATLSFTRSAPRVRIGARAATSLRHYPSLERFVGSSHSAGTDLTVHAGRRTTLQATVDGTYVSQFAFDTISRRSGLGNSALVSTGLDIAALDGARVTYGAGAGLTRKVGLRSVLTLNVGARKSERRTIGEFADERMMGGHFARSIGPNTSVGFEYALRHSSQQIGRDTRPAWGEDLQFAVEHGWRHSRERRTVVSLSAGPSLLQLPAAGPAVSSDRLGVVGSAALSHDMSRSWNLGTSYRRGAGSVDGLQSDTAAFDLRGLLNRRTDLTISAGYSRTDLGLGVGSSRYTTTFGSSRVQLALTRAIALYAQYVLYHYDVGAAIPLPAQTALQQQRRGVRAGLTLWMPLHEGR
jgi:hypothetical protein